MREEGKTIVVLALAGLVAGAGCIGGSECRITDRGGEKTGSRIKCGNEEAVETSENVEGPCFKEGGKIKCESGETFSTGGPEDGGGEETADGDVGLEQDGFGRGEKGDSGAEFDGEMPGRDDRDGGVGFDVETPGGGESPGGGLELDGTGRSDSWSSECKKRGRTVVCEDGRRVRVEPEVEGPCKSKTILGKGRRIVCEDGTQVRPDNRDEGKVSCEFHREGPRGVIRCSDGTVVSVSEEEMPEKACTPEVRRISDTSMIVECGSTEKKVSWQKGCVGSFWLETKEDLARFSRKGCRIVVGDLKVRAPRCEVEGKKVDCPDTEVVEMGEAPTEPCWRTEAMIECLEGAQPAPSPAPFEVVERLEGFRRLQYVTGSLVVVGNPELKMVGFRNLIRVGKDVVVSRNTELRELRGFPKVKFVGGGLEVSRNPALQGWQPPLDLWLVNGKVEVSSNKKLKLIGNLNNGNPRFSSAVNIKGGAAIVTDNDDLGWCLSMEFARYLGRRGAGEIIVGGVSSTGNRCRRVNWMK